MKDGFKHPDVVRVLSLLEVNPGIAEYLFWQTIEGQRSVPIAFVEPPCADDIIACKRLRDELKTWPVYDTVTKTWELVPIDDWREHATGTTLNDLINEEYQLRAVRR